MFLLKMQVKTKLKILCSNNLLKLLEFVHLHYFVLGVSMKFNYIHLFYKVFSGHMQKDMLIDVHFDRDPNIHLELN